MGNTDEATKEIKKCKGLPAMANGWSSNIVVAIML